MTDAELHVALREVIAIGRRGGYDSDEIADKLIRVVRDYANDFAAMKLREAADAAYRDGPVWGTAADVVADLRARAEVFGHLL